MGNMKSGTVVAAWLVAAISALMIFGLIGVPLFTGTRPELGGTGMLFVAFFAVLPLAFVQVAREARQLRDENRALRERLDAALGESHRQTPTGSS